MLKKKRKFTCC